MEPPERPSDRLTLVWLDADEAVILRWAGGPTTVRVVSDVPAHRRSTGHVRIDPAIRHGGGREQDAHEPHRIEHLRRYLHEVAERIAPEDDVEILGPGTVREHLERLLRDDDRAHGRTRTVRGAPSPPLTPRQLLARLRAGAGAAPPRGMPGAR